MTTKRITQGDVLERIKGLSVETQKAIVCALVGHSRIVQSCFGQITCARCDAILGDTLAGCYDLKDRVIVGHNCPHCREVYATLTWRDKLLAPSEEEVFNGD
jgi:hypothetical protein